MRVSNPPLGEVPRLFFPSGVLQPHTASGCSVMAKNRKKRKRKGKRKDKGLALVPFFRIRCSYTLENGSRNTKKKKGRRGEERGGGHIRSDAEVVGCRNVQYVLSRFPSSYFPILFYFSTGDAPEYQRGDVRGRQQCKWRDRQILPTHPPPSSPV